MGKDYGVTGTPGPECTQISGFSPCELSQLEKNTKKASMGHRSCCGSLDPSLP